MASATEQKYLESQGLDTQNLGHGSTQDMVPVAGDHSPLVSPPKGPKKLVEAYILCFPLGLFGAHHFYLRRYGFGVLYFFTFGLLGCGFVVDLFRMPWLVKETNKRLTSERRAGLRSPKSLSDAYVLWFPLGLFGLHHFYLLRIGWGLLYVCTFGLLGMGWVIDGFRMKSVVDHVNQKRAARAENMKPVREVALSDVYILTANPITGLLGIQHYYLGRIGFGIYYTFTLGGMGIGWLIDIFRMTFLVRDVNKRRMEGDAGQKRLDDAYILLIPLGFLGLHHFFLNRPCWGVLYLLTFGCFGIGWIIDLFRLPFLVKDYNKMLPERINTVSGSTPSAGNVIVVVGPQNMVVCPPPPSTPHQGGQPAHSTYPQLYPPQQQQAAEYGAGQILGPQPPQYYPSVDYGTAGETSWSTINSSDFDQPPSYQASLAEGGAPDPQVQNDAANQKSAAPAGPTAPTAPDVK